jgi:two-component system phosphate regulon sensor histidine kinase PhoR
MPHVASLLEPEGRSSLSLNPPEAERTASVHPGAPSGGPRRSLGVRGRLFLVSAALILSMGLTSAVYLEYELRSELEARVANELERHARTARTAASVEGHLRGPEALQGLVLRLATDTEARITLIDPQGGVLADSALKAEGLAGLSGHDSRPEVLAARSKGRGVSRRASQTLGEELLYVALPGPDGVVVRASMPLATVDAAVHRMHILLLVAGALSLAVALFMTGLAARLVARPLRDLLESARSVAERHGRLPLPDGADELGGLASSIDRLGRNLQEVVETLAAERDRMEAVLEGMDEAVVALDAAGHVALINRAGLKLLGLDTVPMGRPLLEAVRAPTLPDALGPALAGRAATVEITLPGASQRHLLARITPQKSSAGAVVVMLDVTRLRQLETMRRDFVANVSHELRTPVSVIRANAETLMAGASDDPVRGPRFLAALLRNAERLSALIADLLDISKIESGKFPIKAGLCAVAEPAAEALENVIPLASAQRTSVTLELDPGLAVRADRKALTQVLTNLLENAVKYIPSGGQVVLSGRPRGTELVILEVRDDGPGIPTEHQGRIFERFYRVDAGRSKEMGGTGLGLSIVKHLVQAMGGDVSVHDNRPRGAVFRVALPAALSTGTDALAFAALTPTDEPSPIREI